jgi:hypothetical protein
MAFAYITLEPNYILLKLQKSISLSVDISAIPSFSFGKLFQTAVGSTLAIGTDYCLEGENIKVLKIEGNSYLLALESNIRFVETVPPPL